MNRIEDSYDSNSNEGHFFKYNNSINYNNNFQENSSKINSINKNMKFYKPKKNQYQNKFKYNSNINKRQYKPKRLNEFPNSLREIQNNKNNNIDNESNSERSISESINQSVSQSISESDHKLRKVYRNFDHERRFGIQRKGK